MATAKQNTISIKIKKGTCQCTPRQRATANGLGLKRRGQIVKLENTPAVRGMIKNLFHLVEVVKED